MKVTRTISLLIAGLPFGFCLAPTDSISDADPAQSGYLPNHNMDPNIVNSTAFQLLWNATFNAQELFYAKPLVFTPSSTGQQLVLLASSQNWIRTLDAVTGAAIESRQVQTPFLSSDIGCTDSPDFIGITGTPVIDPNTETVYFFATTYIPNFRVAGDTGLLNGVMYFYAINIVTLQDVPGFPILIDGTVMQNDPLRYFLGGIQNQRASLVLINDTVYGGFASHCDYFNYTGMVIGISTTAARVVTAFATEAGAGTRHDVYNVEGGGGQAGIWMSGMAPATLGDGRIFLVTGNGEGQINGANPAPGSSGLTTLDECILNLAVSADGVLSLTDYFEPKGYITLDQGDQDLGSGGIALLNSSVFNGTGVAQIGVVVGKSGTIYIVNADNLGGYKEGLNQSDAVIQTLQMPQGVWGGCGAYNHEGGYIYCSPINSNTYVFKFGNDGQGAPLFTQVTNTTETSVFGVGPPTITSYKDQPGTGIVWSTDPAAGLRAWFATPGPDGLLESIPLPKTPGIWKFQRAVFGDGRVYIIDANGTIYCMGT